MQYIFWHDVGKMAPGDDILVCPVCNVNVSDNDNGLQCDAFCNKWHHASCVDVNNKNYKKITELGDSVKWICVICAGKLTSMRRQSISAVDYVKSSQCSERRS